MKKVQVLGSVARPNCQFLRKMLSSLSLPFSSRSLVDSRSGTCNAIEPQAGLFPPPAHLPETGPREHRGNGPNPNQPDICVVSLRQPMESSCAKIPAATGRDSDTGRETPCALMRRRLRSLGTGSSPDPVFSLYRKSCGAAGKSLSMRPVRETRGNGSSAIETGSPVSRGCVVEISAVRRPLRTMPLVVIRRLSFRRVRRGPSRIALTSWPRTRKGTRESRVVDGDGYEGTPHEVPALDFHLIGLSTGRPIPTSSDRLFQRSLADQEVYLRSNTAARIVHLVAGPLAMERVDDTERDMNASPWCPADLTTMLPDGSVLGNPAPMAGPLPVNTR